MTPRTILARLVALNVLAAFPAAAQEPPSPPLPAATAAHPASAPPPRARETAITVLGSYTCALREHADIDPDDADTTADVVCHALDTHHAREGAYDIRL